MGAQIQSGSIEIISSWRAQPSLWPHIRCWTSVPPVSLQCSHSQKTPWLMAVPWHPLGLPGITLKNLHQSPTTLTPLVSLVWMSRLLKFQWFNLLVSCSILVKQTNDWFVWNLKGRIICGLLHSLPISWKWSHWQLNPLGGAAEGCTVFSPLGHTSGHLQSTVWARQGGDVGTERKFIWWRTAVPFF